MGLLDLPQELILRILSYLELADFASVSQTHSIIHSYGATSQALQYRFAVQAAAVNDNSHSLLAIAERLSLLRSQEDGWSRFQFDFVKAISVPQQTSGIHHAAGGLFLLGETEHKSVTYCKLPSSAADTVTWSKIDIERPIIELCVSAHEHDLIVIATCTPHANKSGVHVVELLLLELSTGKPHPLAINPAIFVQEMTRPRPSLCLEVVGDHVAIVVTISDITFQPDPNDIVYVFNWKTENTKLRIQASNHTYRYVTFLSPTLILLPNTWSNTLELWLIPADDVLSTPPPSFPQLSLGLPSMEYHELTLKLSCRAEPNPTLSGTPFSMRPFHASAENAIMVFTILSLSLRTPHINSFSMFVHRSSLLNLLRDTVKIHMEWKEWGPPVTRWFLTGGVASRWIMTSAGQRCILSYFANSNNGEDRAVSIVLDFNPLTVKKLAVEHGICLSPAHADAPAASSDQTHPKRRRKLLSSMKGAAKVVIGLLRLGKRPNRQRRINSEHIGLGGPEISETGPELASTLPVPEQMKIVTTRSWIHHDAFKEPVESGLPYMSVPCQDAGGKQLNFSGLLMDEERLLGLRTNVQNKIIGIDVMHMGVSRNP